MVCNRVVQLVWISTIRTSVLSLEILSKPVLICKRVERINNFSFHSYLFSVLFFLKFSYSSSINRKK